MKRSSALICSLLLALPVSARSGGEICGTFRERVLVDAQRHRASMRARMLRQGVRRDANLVRAVGNLVVMDDTDAAVSRADSFDLGGRTLILTPSAQGADKPAAYTWAVGPASYDAAAASAGTPLDGLGDDDARRVALPFAFPFYGIAWREIYVESDGNLTFGQAETNTSARSLGRMTAGPPRIAPLFDDLDPSSSGSVRVLAAADRMVVSWVDVPEWGNSTTQRFQARLFPDGRIEFAWAQVSPATAVVGVAPGALQGGVTVVSFLNDPPAPTGGALAESFGSGTSVDPVRVAQLFYEQFEDAYDYLVIYNRMGIQAAAGAIAYESTVRGAVKGIGDAGGDYGLMFGSPARLHAVLNMGSTTQYPADPYGLVGARGHWTGDNVMSILAHETGHLYLARASVRDPADPTARPMLGNQLAHWGFNFNSEASLLEGNRIRDNGAASDPNTRFITTGTVEGYAPLDQYLMGFRAPWEVPPTFLVTGSSASNTNLPHVGVSFGGTRRDVRIEDVIAAEGARIPDYTVAQRRYRFAFILITPAGLSPSDTELATIEGWRREFENYFAKATGGRASADTRLLRATQSSLAPAGGLIAGRGAQARIDLATVPDNNLTYRIDTDRTVVDAPASVTVPAGQKSASITLNARTPGVADFLMTPDNGAFESAVARVNVRASVDGLRLQPVSGYDTALISGQPQTVDAAFRVVDSNDVPYAGQSVSATADGSLEAPRVTSDALGNVHFRWTTSSAADRVLMATLDERPAILTEISVLGPAHFEPAGVVNAASFQAGLTPGGLASIFGFNLWSGRPQGPISPWPASLDGVRVLVNGTPAHILVTNLRQLNFLVPRTVAAGNAQIVVANAVGRSDAMTVPVVPVQPALFFDAASGRAAARQVGRFFELYGTGLGDTFVDVDGLEETYAPVEAEVDGRTALVWFSGLSPGIPGLYQVNIELPSGLGPGEYSVRLNVGSLVSNTVRLKVE